MTAATLWEMRLLEKCPDCSDMCVAPCPSELRLGQCLVKTEPAL